MSKKTTTSLNKKVRLLTKDRILTKFILISLIFGTVFVFAIPPFCSYDEATHTYRIYQLSTGNLIGDKLTPNKTGGLIPTNIANLTEKYRSIFFLQKKMSFQEYKQDSLILIDGNYSAPVNFENTALYSPINYIPQIIVMWFLRIINVPVLFSLYTLRMISLLMWIAVCAIALRIMQTKKIFMFVILLNPLSLFLASSLNTDGISIAFSALILAMFSLYYKKDRLTNKNLLLYASLWSYLALLKPPYFLIGFLIYILPNHKTPTRINKIIKYIMFILPLFMFLLWSYLSHLTYAPYRTDALTDTAFQLKILINQPYIFVISLFNTYASNFSNYLPAEIFNIFVNITNPIPIWLTFSWFMFLGMVALYKNKSETIFDKKTRLFTFFLILVVFLAINALLFVSWTTPGANIIQGLIGRYFIPILLMLSIPLSSLRVLKVNGNKFLRYSFGVTILFLIYSLGFLFQNIYLVFY